MKIAVTGTHRTGKTSLVEELSNQLQEYSHEEEPYFLLEESGHLFSEEPTTEDYIAQFEHLCELINNSEGNTIFDRSPIDLLAYIQATDDYDNVDFDSLYQKAQTAISEIDLVVLVPIEEPDIVPHSEDNLPELREQVNHALHDLVWEFDMEWFEVNGSLQERKEQVLERFR